MEKKIKYSKRANHLFTKSNKGEYVLTDAPFIKDVYIVKDGEMVNSGKAKCYIYGPIKKGQFVSTYYLYGIGFATSMEAVAFAISLQDKNDSNIGEIEIEFLPRPNAEGNEVAV